MTIIGPYYTSHGLLTNGHAATREEAMAKFCAPWDGTPRAYRDLKPLAIEAAEHLERKHPHSAVVVNDLESSETIAVEYKPD